MWAAVELKRHRCSILIHSAGGGGSTSESLFSIKKEEEEKMASGSVCESCMPLFFSVLVCPTTLWRDRPPPNRPVTTSLIQRDCTTYSTPTPEWGAVGQQTWSLRRAERRRSISRFITLKLKWSPPCLQDPRGPPGRAPPSGHRV